MNEVKINDISKSEFENILKALNTIKSAEELVVIAKIPLEIAEAILEHRLRNGLFTNLMQVRDIPQIGPGHFYNIIENLKDFSPPSDKLRYKIDARIPVLNYEIPSPSSYEGRSYIEIGLDPEKVIYNTNVKNTMPLQDYLNLNKEYISEYITNATKEEIEKQLYVVFDLEATVSEELELYNGTYTFQDGTLEGWTYRVKSGNRVEVHDSKTGHNKVAYIEGDKQQWLSNLFSAQSSGTIELWAFFTNYNQPGWWSHIDFHGVDASGATKHAGNLIITNNNLYWYKGYASSPADIILIKEDAVGKWIHINMTWTGNSVTFQTLGDNEVNTVFNTGINGIIKLSIVSSKYAQVWIDAIGFSWDENYNIGDNLSKSLVTTKKEAIDPEILNALETLDEASLKDKYNIFKYLVNKATTGPSGEKKRLPVFSRTMGGKIKLRWVYYTLRPRIYFIETYKLTNFPGDYGPGRLLKTFSLLPGEETEITIKSWKRSVTSAKEASSILDSYTEDKADEFEKNLQTEGSQSTKIEESDTFSIEASAKLTMSVVSAEVGIEYEKSMKSNRENFAKNIANTTSKHSQKASSKREVNIETSYEKTEDAGLEEAIVRKVENLNLSRTLNFIFRQMNQQHHSILHLTDVKLAFFSGFPGSMKEYELNELDDLLREYTSNPEVAFDYLYQKILDEYGNGNILDHLGTPRTLVKEVIIPEGVQTEDEIKHKYLRVLTPKEGGTSDYIMREEGAQKDIRTVEGIIIRTNVITMRTDGVTVEALLGESNALDNYAVESVKRDQLNNAAIQSEVDKVNIGIEIIKNLIEIGQLDKAIDAYKEIFGMRESLKSITEILGAQKLELERKLVE